jgi:arylsulfatase A-like enzyme
MEQGVRSPLVVRLPEGKRAGQRLDALVDLVDVHATVLDYAGAAVPPGSHGRSLRPLLEERAFEPRERLFGGVYTRFGNALPAESLYALYARDARWKYVLYLREVTGRELSPGARFAPPFRARAGQQRLFDLALDPREEHNLAASAEHAERMRDLRASVLAWWRESGGAELELPGSAR